MMTARHFDKKNRNNTNRKPKPIILIVAEGDNVTESQYFKSFQKQNSPCVIRLIIAKHITDPEGMLRAVKSKWKEMELDERKGDRAYVVLDVDCDENKARLIDNLQQSAKDVQFIISNPCFEVWFLMHFHYSTKQYLSADAVIKELTRYIPQYKKNMDVLAKIEQLRGSAIANAEKLRKHLNDIGYEWPMVGSNPYTDVDIIIKKIN